jgi:hypothetical protein
MVIYSLACSPILKMEDTYSSLTSADFQREFFITTAERISNPALRNPSSAREHNHYPANHIEHSSKAKAAWEHPSNQSAGQKDASQFQTVQHMSFFHSRHSPLQQPDGPTKLLFGWRGKVREGTCLPDCGPRPDSLSTNLMQGPKLRAVRCTSGDSIHLACSI